MRLEDSSRVVSMFRITDALAALLPLALMELATVPEPIPASIEGALAIEVSLGTLLLWTAVGSCWLLSFFLFGLYEKHQPLGRRGELAGLMGGGALAAAITVVLIELGSGHHVHVWQPPVLWALSVSLAIVMRGLVRRCAGALVLWRPSSILIVGSGPQAVGVYEQLGPEEKRHVLGFVDSSRRIRYPIVRDRLLGSLDDLEHILATRVVDDVVIALPVKSCYAAMQSVVETCERVGVRASYVADLFHRHVATPRMTNAVGLPAVALQVTEDDSRLLLKRAIDTFGAIVGLVLLSPLFALIAVAIKVESPGPVFFTQERFGYRKRLFSMLKFRTMVEDAERLQGDLEDLNEADGPVFKLRHDPRITRVGRFLRKTSLDELPQLINVLRGEMSVVGPRPLPKRDVKRFDEPWLLRRFSVLPGMTGLWQVSGRSDSTFEYWMRKDLEYIDEWSLWLDWMILLRTPVAVLTGKGAA